MLLLFQTISVCNTNSKKNTGFEEINKNVNQITRHFLLFKVCKLIQEPIEYLHCSLQSRASGKFQKTFTKL